MHALIPKNSCRRQRYTLHMANAAMAAKPRRRSPSADMIEPPRRRRAATVRQVALPLPLWPRSAELPELRRL